MKTLFFIPLIAVIVRATPTIRSVSTLTLCAAIIMMGDWPCISGSTLWSPSKMIVIHWIIVLIRKFVLRSQPNVSLLMLNFAGDNCFLRSLWSRSYQAILPWMSQQGHFWRVLQYSFGHLWLWWCFAQWRHFLWNGFLGLYCWLLLRVALESFQCIMSMYPLQMVAGKNVWALHGVKPSVE